MDARSADVISHTGDLGSINNLPQKSDLRLFSWRDTDAPYEILVAEILLQRTAAEKVKPIYDKLMATYPTLEMLADADQDKLTDFIYSLGLQNQRSKALITIGLCPAFINRSCPSQTVV
jgi:endonuclease III